MQLYSKCGRTSDLYAVALRSVLQGCKFLYTSPRTRLALETHWFMCESHFRSLVIETPRYECESVSCNIDWPSVYWWVDFVLECETFSTKHFLALNCICQLSCHSESVFKSVCKRSTSESSWMGRYITQSSANKRTSDVILSGRSFIYAKNKRGPRTVPWGTPDLTCTHCEWSPSTTTLVDA